MGTSRSIYVTSLVLWQSNTVQIFLNNKPREVQLVALKSSLTVTGAKTEQSPAFEQECVVLFASFLRVLGAPNSVGAIYGLLFASRKPLCFTEIVERLDMSKGSVSQGLAFLRQSGAVKVLEISGDRREFFEPELGLRRLASGLIREKIQPLATETKGAVARLKQHAQTGRSAQYEFQLERIKQLETWHKQLGQVLPLLQTILSVRRQ